MDKWIQQDRPIWDGGAEAPVASSRPAYYYCISCNAIEKYMTIPQQGGEDMWPWHNHGAQRIALRPVGVDDLDWLAQRGATLPLAPSEEGRARRVDVARHPLVIDPPKMPVGSSRLQILMTKLAKEGW